MDQIYTTLKKYGKVRLSEPMSKHTTFKLGGPAKYFIAIDNIDNLVEVLNFLREENVEFIIIGGGSNVLCSDREFDGVVIKINDQRIEISEQIIMACAGAMTVSVAQSSVKAGLTGFEWGIGVPGTIGGATRGNAGAMGGDMSDNFEKVEVYRQGEVLELSSEECEFAYRESVFKHNNDVILRVWLKLKKSSEESKDLMKKALENIAYRNSTQPQGFASSGCIFKNIEVKSLKSKVESSLIPQEFLEKGVISAGWLVDNAGCKGMKIGKAQVSEKHANFIVNLGGATAEDVKNLIEEVKTKVYNKFKINLETEVQEISF